MYCKNCGREISDTADICLFCGARTRFMQPIIEDEKKVNGFGIAGFVLGILSFLLSLAGVMPLLGLIFSAIGMAKMGKRKVNGLAIAGLVLSIIALILAICIDIVVIYLVISTY